MTVRFWVGKVRMYGVFEHNLNRAELSGNTVSDDEGGIYIVTYNKDIWITACEECVEGNGKNWLMG